MSKIRLSNDDRRAIAAAVVGHKFNPLKAALNAEQTRVCEDIRRRAYGDFLPVMESAPSGAFDTRSGLTVNVGGARYKLTSQVAMRVFAAHDGWAPMLSLDAADDLGEAIQDLAQRLEDHRQQRDHLEATTRATIAGFYTFEALIEAWPEAEAFIKARWTARAHGPVNLPAVDFKSLTGALDLPPETQAAAA